MQNSQKMQRDQLERKKQSQLGGRREGCAGRERGLRAGRGAVGRERELQAGKGGYRRGEWGYREERELQAGRWVCRQKEESTGGGGLQAGR